MMPSPRSTEAAIKRALAAWTATGMAVGSLQIAPDGTIRIEAPVANGTESPQPASVYDAWRAKRGAG